MVADLADRFYVLDYGEHLTDEDSATVLADPCVIAAYLGSGEHRAARSAVR